MNRFCLPLFLAVGLSACATTSETSPASTPEVPVAATPTALLADRTAAHLAHLARHDPERLDPVLPELQALAAALSNAPERSEAPMPDDLPRAPAMPSARSLQHGVHLASYRIRENALSGWRELQADHPQLVDLQARFEPRDLGEQGVFLRLKAGPFDSHGAALGFCAGLAGDAVYCMPVDFTGDPLVPMSAGGGQ